MRSARKGLGLSARAKRRHPHEKGGLIQRSITKAFRRLLTNTFWLRHSEPFAKRKVGRKRRAERRFRQSTKEIEDA